MGKTKQTTCSSSDCLHGRTAKLAHLDLWNNKDLSCQSSLPSIISVVLHSKLVITTHGKNTCKNYSLSLTIHFFAIRHICSFATPVFLLHLLNGGIRRYQSILSFRKREEEELLFSHKTQEQSADIKSKWFSQAVNSLPFQK